MTIRLIAALALAALLAGACASGSSAPEVLGVVVERSGSPSTEPASEPPAPPASWAPSPEPEPSPSPRPARLAEGDGNTYTWTSRDEPEEGWWWVEASSLPPSPSDESEWNGQRVTTVDVAPRSDSNDPGTQPVVRRAGCVPSISAPGDRAVAGSGNLTVELLVNGDVGASAFVPFDGEVAAGTRRTFDRVGDVQVDAREGDDVACTVRFDAS